VSEPAKQLLEEFAAHEKATKDAAKARLMVSVPAV